MVLVITELESFPKFERNACAALKMVIVADCRKFVTDITDGRLYWVKLHVFWGTWRLTYKQIWYAQDFTVWPAEISYVDHKYRNNT